MVNGRKLTAMDWHSICFLELTRDDSIAQAEMID